MDHVSKSGDELMKNKTLGPWGSSIKQVRKIFQKTNISNPLIAHVGVRNRESEILVFQKILHTYLMGGLLFESPLVSKTPRVRVVYSAVITINPCDFFVRSKSFLYTFSETSGCYKKTERTVHFFRTFCRFSGPEYDDVNFYGQSKITLSKM